MPLEYKKANSVRLREVGKDESWLQEVILADPSILGLGDLLIIQRERIQPTGGRIDFVMSDPEEGIRYEVEIMLGTLDESHIIRTIEYWDVERRRFPNLEHRAVIVAEDITNRFFNVIGLLNRSVPIIAIQLSTLVYENYLFLNFVKVLDLLQEEYDEDQTEQETVDRGYWVSRSNENSITLMDNMIEIIHNLTPTERVTYNRHHVALGTSGNNFCWFHPRKSSRIHLHLKINEDILENTLRLLEEKGIESGIHKKNIIKIIVNTREYLDNTDTFNEIFRNAEFNSRR